MMTAYGQSMEGLPANRGLGIRPLRLVCVACEDVARGQAWGWRAYLDADDDVAIYCGDCAEREFGADEATG